MEQNFFRDRSEAGMKLANKLEKYRDKNAVVYSLPRGGVVIGGEIAKKLNIPLDVIISRKIGHQYNPEYAICALSEDVNLICNENEVSLADPLWLKKKVEIEQEEIVRRRNLYLGGEKPISPKGEIAIVTDDGIATGLTMRAGILWLKSKNPKKIILALPVIPKDRAQLFAEEVDEIVALTIPEYYLGAVSAYYDDFPQVSDEEVTNILLEHKNKRSKYEKV